MNSLKYQHLVTIRYPNKYAWTEAFPESRSRTYGFYRSFTGYAEISEVNDLMTGQTYLYFNPLLGDWEIGDSEIAKMIRYIQVEESPNQRITRSGTVLPGAVG